MKEPKGFVPALDAQNQCCWVDENDIRCDQPPIASRWDQKSTTCHTHSYKLVGEGYYTFENEYPRYHETKPSRWQL